MGEPKPNSSVTSKMLALLAAFDRGHRELTLTELSRRAGVSLATTHRRARELVEWGALEQLEDGRYRIGLRLWELGSLAPRGQQLREVALPFMEDLYVVTRENVQLAVRQGTELVFVERLVGRQAIPVMTRVGSRFTLHATGVGLVLLAHAPPEIQEEILAGPLTRYTPHTVTDPVRLRRMLAGVRRDGYAVSDQLVQAGALSVAAPVHGPHGDVVAALSLVVLAEGATVTQLVAAVRTAARAVSRALGQHQPAPDL
jgi:DNA-binding IclR family transcriptional regulator